VTVADVIDIPAPPSGGDTGQGGGGGGGDGEGGDGAGRGRRKLPFAPIVAGVVAVAVGLMFVVLAGANPVTDEKADTPLLDKPAPEVVGTTIDGTSFDLARRKGSWVVLNFFQSDCQPCKAEHEQLVQFAAQQDALGTAGAEIYTIATPPDSDQAVRDFFTAYGGGDWPVLRDYEGQAMVAFGVAKVPETWIIDPNGIVRGRFISQVTAVGLQSALTQLQASYG
jgi:cytochrome c biogenesis protein CcmG/thiol:disulfide interchange protein DsbE